MGKEVVLSWVLYDFASLRRVPTSEMSAGLENSDLVWAGRLEGSQVKK